MAKSFDHICILVNDIDKAIERYKNILSVCAPEIVNQEINRYKSIAEGDESLTAIFRPVGDGCGLQLMQPLNPESRLYQRLMKYGEHIHHLAFASSRLEDDLKELEEKGVTLRSGAPIRSKRYPTRSWSWIMPQYAHGALIEVMDEREK